MPYRQKGSPYWYVSLTSRSGARLKRSMFVWSHEDGQPLKDVRGSLERACTRAGIERITPHVLRHTCASWQVQAGVPLYSVQRWLGHSTIKMTERYAHLAPEHLQEGAAALAGAVDKAVDKSA